jgi:hypothetical protein
LITGGCSNKSIRFEPSASDLSACYGRFEYRPARAGMRMVWLSCIGVVSPEWMIHTVGRVMSLKKKKTTKRPNNKTQLFFRSFLLGTLLFSPPDSTRFTVSKGGAIFARALLSATRQNTTKLE